MSDARPEVSDFSVPVVKIGAVEKHPSADTLSMTKVFGENCIFKTGSLREGDLAVYVPIDAVVPLNQPAFAFLKKNENATTVRIKAIRLRQIYSEGLLIPLDAIEPPLNWSLVNSKGSLEGEDVAARLGIIKYEEPERNISTKGLCSKKIKFAPDYAVQHLLKYQKQFSNTDKVMVTEKIHGCNIRFTFLSKIGAEQNGVEPGLHVGSHKTWRKEKLPDSKTKAIWKGLGGAVKKFTRSVSDRSLSMKEIKDKTTEAFFKSYTEARAYREDLWIKAVKAANLEETLRWTQDHVIYGELYGQVQDLTYGVDDTEVVKIRIFDIYDLERRTWWHPEDVKLWCETNSLDFVPVLYEGRYDLDKIKAIAYEKSSTIDSETIREGAVVRNLSSGDFRPYKIISPAYKLRNNGTEFH